MVSDRRARCKPLLSMITSGSQGSRRDTRFFSLRQFLEWRLSHRPPLNFVGSLIPAKEAR